jgi:hypothetical protein
MAGSHRGAFWLDEDHIAQTHSELLQRLDDPRRTITVQSSVEASPERAWAVTGSAERLFSHQPRYAALSRLRMPGSAEGSRYVIHRTHEGKLYNRVSEVLVDFPLAQLSVSDIDIADPSVAGHFPSLFTVRVEEDPNDATRCTVQVSYTTLGVVPPLMPAVLLLQLRSIQESAEEAYTSMR